MNYFTKKEVPLSFSLAVEKTKIELSKEGFGILTQIDVKMTLKQKLDKDYDNYIILGACNAHFAYKALTAEKEIGLLLPCNIIIYEDKEKVFVATIVPSMAMSMVENSALADISKEVDEKLKIVIKLI